MTENDAGNMIRVVICRPGEQAEVDEIDTDLEAMQEIVGGLIQEYMPFHSETDSRYEDLALITNEEGRLLGMPPNRAIFDENGQLMDVIQGPFFLCFAPIESETFQSLPEDLEEEFLKKFEKPEQFYRTERGIEVIRFDPKKQERNQER